MGTDTFGPPSTNLRVKIEPHFRGPGYWVSSSISMSVHTGSHIDSRSHVFKGAEDVDRIVPETLIGKPVVVRLNDSIHESSPIKPEHFRNYKIESNDIVLVETGWSDKMWGRFPDYYTKSPFLSPEAATFLAERKIRAIGFDFFEEYNARLPEFGSEDFVVHRILLGAGVILMEHLSNLKALKANSIFLAAPLNLKGVEGSPASFFALEP